MNWHQTERERAMHENRLLRKLIRLHEEEPRDMKQIKYTKQLLTKYEKRK